MQKIAFLLFAFLALCSYNRVNASIHLDKRTSVSDKVKKLGEDIYYGVCAYATGIYTFEQQKRAAICWGKSIAAPSAEEPVPADWEELEATDEETFTCGESYIFNLKFTTFGRLPRPAKAKITLMSANGDEIETPLYDGNIVNDNIISINRVKNGVPLDIPQSIGVRKWMVESGRHRLGIGSDKPGTSLKEELRETKRRLFATHATQVQLKGTIPKNIDTGDYTFELEFWNPKMRTETLLRTIRTSIKIHCPKDVPVGQDDSLNF